VTKTIIIIVSAVVFALIGLLAGWMGLKHLNPGGDRFEVVFGRAIGPTVGGALLGFIVGTIAVLLGRK
jgi:hypothetical protein